MALANRCVQLQLGMALDMRGELAVKVAPRQAHADPRRGDQLQPRLQGPSAAPHVGNPLGGRAHCLQLPGAVYSKNELYKAVELFDSHLAPSFPPAPLTAAGVTFAPANAIIDHVRIWGSKRGSASSLRGVVIHLWRRS